MLLPHSLLHLLFRYIGREAELVPQPLLSLQCSTQLLVQAQRDATAARELLLRYARLRLGARLRCLQLLHLVLQQGCDVVGVC